MVKKSKTFPHSVGQNHNSDREKNFNTFLTMKEQNSVNICLSHGDAENKHVQINKKTCDKMFLLLAHLNIS